MGGPMLLYACNELNFHAEVCVKFPKNDFQKFYFRGVTGFNCFFPILALSYVTKS